MSMNLLDITFLNEMVQALYHFEAVQVREMNLLSNCEMEDFYAAYCCL